MARAKKSNVGQLRRALKERDEARAFQAATDEILTAISRSTSDAKPVFDAIVRNVPRLFDTRYVAVFLIKGEVLHLAAAKADAAFQRRHGARFRRFQQSFPQPIHWGGFTGKALRSGKVSQIGPIIGNPKASPQAVKIAKEFGYDTMLVAPLMRDGKAIGAIGTTRPGVKLFSAKELALFKAFAAQAVIAIENARLFNETKEALERQTATAEILKVISASPTSTQPVFESIVNNCGILFKDSRVALWQISEGRLLPRASTGYMPEPMPLDRESAIGACVLESRTIHLADLRSGAEQYPRIKQLGLKHGYLSGVYAPLLREGQAIGAISLLRRELGAFSDKEVALLATFADQAVIAIENARLFNETKEALEQQTTTAGVLRVIAGSPTDLKPVMTAVVEKAARLLEADHALIGQADSENIHWLAAYGCPVPDGARSITRELPSGRAILDLQTTQIEDIGQIERDSLLERSYGRFGVRTICATPLIREGRAVGVILLRRTQVRPFTEKQMSLLRTFADQAVIAIENARLFNETKEALERQTATSEILGVISSSPTDLRPVFEAILESATRLCDAHLGVLNLFEGELCRTVAQRGGSPEFAKWVLERGAFKPVAAMARILADRRPFHVPDAREGPGFKARDANAMKFVELGGVRTYLAVPLLKEGAVIGSINIFRPEIRPFADKQIALVSTFANQAVIAIENVRLFNETKEALERQTATSEILKAIASSVRDVQPVFEAIVANATDLCEAQFGALFLVSGDVWRMVSHRGASAAAQEAYRSFRAAPTTGIGRMVRECKPIHIQDLLADAATAQRDPLRMATIEKLGARTFLAVPLLKDGEVIGAVVTYRKEVRPFGEAQIRLLTTFADQAVIAIENARLFNETKEALERQTATAEVLKVISSSPADIQPVFDSIIEHAMRLCDAHLGTVGLYDGKSYRHVAQRGSSPEYVKFLLSAPFAPDPSYTLGRMIAEQSPVHLADYRELPAYRQGDPRAVATVELGGARSFLAVPMVKEGRVIGGITLRRPEVRPFTKKQIDLVSTFANQAVIAIENVRLFNETMEALERQTATAEILKVIAASPADVQPVFRAILENATRLCGAHLGFLSLYDGEKWQTVAHLGANPEFAEWIVGRGRFTPSPGSGLDQMLAVRVPVHIADYRETSSYRERYPMSIKLVEMGGVRSYLAVPMLKDGRIVGGISVYRAEVRTFEQKQIELLSTFADQAVIAIENVRLFNETREALERQTATAEILRVISGSPTDTRPVFDVIAKSAMRLFGGLNVAILLRREKDFVLAGYSGPGVEDLPEQVRTAPLDPEKNFPSRAILEGKVLNIIDWEGSDVPEHERLVARSLGIKSGLMVPLLRQGEGIGAIAVLRATEGPFIDKDIALLQSFADQAVIAIENVRLFNETKEALEQQTAISEVLRVISGSPTDVQPVLEAVAERAMRICDAKDARIFLVDGQELRYAAGQGDVRMGEIGMRRPLDRGLVMGRAVIDREPVQVEDLERAGEEFPLGRQAHLQHGHRTALAVPLLREKQALGAILLRRMEVRPFSEKQIALLKTFADQAAIAIENVRLFNETREALERQTATGEILASISSAIDNTQPVFDAIVESLRRLLNTHYAVVSLIEDGKGVWKAMSGDKRITDRVKAAYPWPVNDERRFVSRVIQSGEVVQLCPLAGNPEAPEASRQIGLESGYDAILVAPLVRAEKVIGYIVTTRAEAIPFNEKQVALIKSFADQAVIAIENVRLFNETKEALERQTATAEILKVISASPSDVQPVFDAVAENAARVCGVDDVAILRTEGDDLRRVAHYGSVPVSPDSLVPVPPGSVNERVLSERQTLHIPDTLAASFTREFPGSQFPAMGVRALLATPLVHDGVAVGVIHLRRSEPRPFTDKQIALLETFAAQAVIAIENVRLFNETREALERQTATGEILASITGSMTDAKPVFDAIVRNLMRLFGTGYAVVSLRRGEVFELGGFRGEPGFERLQEVYPLPVDRNTIIGEVVIARQVRKYTPVVGNPAVPRGTAELGQRFGFNSVMAAPMMWKGEAIGVILTARRQALPFDDKQVALIQSFADQAVIAIENVRLFKELQERTEALTKSVSQLTALGEVGQAISSSLELETVLKTIVQRAVELAGLDGGSIYEFDEGDGRFHLRAAEHVEEEILAVSRKSPIRLGEGVVGRAGATREPVVVEDVLDESYKSRVRELLIKSGSRALLAVPLLREDFLLGALVVYRKSPGPFAREVIELLKTFATQSAVAIQNARLFREIAEKSSQLEEASRHKSQFLASMSHELRTPLNAILGFNEMILGQVYGEVPLDMKEPLEDIQKSGKHLLRLINNVLDLAKIEAGKMELSLADYSVHDTVESVRSTLRPLAEAKGLELVVSVPEDIPLAYGDGGRLTQCLMNLAGNSLKFTKQGKVEIAVEAENGCLRWRVSDTGIGIPPDKISTLFSEFKQTDATIASEYGGTGLGLSITKKFVEMHGGRIWVESELGKGSVFTLEIPLRVTGPA